MSKTKAGPEFKNMVDAQMKAQGARPNQPQMSTEDQAMQAKMVGFRDAYPELQLAEVKVHHLSLHSLIFWAHLRLVWPRTLGFHLGVYHFLELGACFSFTHCVSFVFYESRTLRVDYSIS